MIYLAKNKLGRVLYHLWGMDSTYFLFDLGKLYSLLPFTFKTSFKIRNLLLERHTQRSRRPLHTYTREDGALGVGRGRTLQWMQL